MIWIRGFVPAVAVGLLLLPVPGYGGQAESQVAFARRALAEGDFSGVLRSAEQAFHMDSALTEALLLKALAYEGLGDLVLAEDYLFAFQDEAGLAQLPREGQALAERIAVARAAARPARAREASAHRVEGLDPVVYRERSQAALRRGSCRAAAAAATELVRAEPQLAEAHRLLGDAAKCRDRLRDAAVSYQRYFDLGGTESSVKDLLTNVLTSLATVKVAVTLTDPSVLPVARLELEGGPIEPSLLDGTSATFTAVPPNTPVSLVVAGRGFAPVRQELGVLGSGETRAVQVAPELIGLGAVAVGSFDAGKTIVRLLTADETVDVAPDEEREITAGEFSILVFSDLGVVEVARTVEPGGTVPFDPSRHLPSGLTITGLPAGAHVEVISESNEGEQMELSRDLPPTRGVIDRASGLRIARETQIDSLFGGKAGVYVSHPLLGHFAREVIIETGAWSTTAFDATEMKGAEAIRLAWQRWRQVGEVQAAGLRRSSAVTGVLGGVLLAGGATMLGLSQYAANRKEFLEVACGVIAGDSEGLRADNPDCQEASRFDAQETGLLVGGVAGLGLGVGSVSVSIVFGSKADKTTRDSGDWDPWAAKQEK